MSLSFPSSPTVGQIYQQWTWSGSAWLPTSSALNIIPGMKVLVQSVAITASTLAATFFQDFSPYDEWVWECYDVSIAQQVNLLAQLSTDGSTFDNGASAYGYASMQAWAGNGGGLTGGVLSGIWVHGAPNVSAVTPSAFQMRTSMLHTSGNTKMFRVDGMEWGASGVGLTVNSNAGDYMTNTLPIRGVRFIPITGNILKGIFNMYGIVPSSVRGS